MGGQGRYEQRPIKNQEQRFIQNETTEKRNGVYLQRQNGVYLQGQNQMPNQLPCYVKSKASSEYDAEQSQIQNRSYNESRPGEDEIFLSEVSNRTEENEEMQRIFSERRQERIQNGMMVQKENNKVSKMKMAYEEDRRMGEPRRTEMGSFQREEDKRLIKKETRIKMEKIKRENEQMLKKLKSRHFKLEFEKRRMRSEAQLHGLVSVLHKKKRRVINYDGEDEIDHPEIRRELLQKNQENANFLLMKFIEEQHRLEQREIELERNLQNIESERVFRLMEYEMLSLPEMARRQRSLEIKNENSEFARLQCEEEKKTY